MKGLSFLIAKKSLKVANVLEEGRYGGPQARVYHVAKELCFSGVETHVLYSRYESEKFTSKLADSGAVFRPLRLHRLTRDPRLLLKYVLFFLPEVFALYRLFKKERYDLVHVNGSYQIKGALAARFVGIPVVWHLNDMHTARPVKTVFSWAAKFCASGFIVAAEGVREFYLHGTPMEDRPVVEIHAPVDVAAFDPGEAIEDSSISSFEGTKIVTVANINAGKGLETLVECASKLNRRHNGLSFLIVGPEYNSQRSYIRKLRALIQNAGVDNLHFIGRVDDVASVLKASDIFAFPSLYEGSPTVIWEAMAMAMPIVTTNVGSTQRYIHQEVNGFLVPRGDAEAMAFYLGRLIENPELRNKLGQAARETAIAELGIGKCAQEHLKFYHKLLAGIEGGKSADTGS